MLWILYWIHDDYEPFGVNAQLFAFETVHRQDFPFRSRVGNQFVVRIDRVTVLVVNSNRAVRGGECAYDPTIVMEFNRQLTVIRGMGLLWPVVLRNFPTRSAQRRRLTAGKAGRQQNKTPCHSQIGHLFRAPSAQPGD